MSGVDTTVIEVVAGLLTVVVTFAQLVVVFGRHSSHDGSGPLHGKRRILVSLGAITTASALAATGVGGTFARLSATKVSGSNAFTTGTVVVGLGAGTSVQCNVTDLVPGDASTGYPSGSGVANQSATQCRYFIKYSGTALAYLALDVAITNGATRLYDGSGTGLQLLVADSAGTTYVGSAAGQGGIKYTTQGGSSFGTTLSSPGTASDLLVSTSAQNSTFTDEFTVDYNLAVPSSNNNIGGSSTVTLTFHAVQRNNNTLSNQCSAAGIACTSGLSWS